jgi:hypothetical protein
VPTVGFDPGSPNKEGVSRRCKPTINKGLPIFLVLENVIAFLISKRWSHQGDHALLDQPKPNRFEITGEHAAQTRNRIYKHRLA